MQYQITKDQFFLLEGVRDQLNLICGLLSRGSDDYLSNTTGAQLYAFLDPQSHTLTGVLAAADELRNQAVTTSREEVVVSKEPQVLVSPELLMGLMDAACGRVNDSAALFKLWDELYDAGLEHQPYGGVLRHFVGVLRDRGHVLHVEFTDGEPSRTFVAGNQGSSRISKRSRAKSRKRDRLTAAA